MNLHPVHHGLRRKMLAVLIAACYTSANANPIAPQVIAGQASFQQNGNLFSITNTPNAIINWQSFSIAPNEITRFIQQGADSRVLNRITGQDPSRILGALQSNGHVYLINPNGIVFGKDARVDVQGLVASSLALSDSDFLARRHRFTDNGGVGKVVNEGAIVTQGGGRVYLVGASVENSGVVTSPQGDVVLAAGRSVQLVDSSDPQVHVVVSAPEDQALNLGQLLAAGGRVGIYGALVNQRGRVNADSAVRGENGRIVLKASGTTLLEQGSNTSAVNSAGQGGDVKLLGQRVGLTGDARVDASGAEGGGQILIGGGYQGKDASVPNAQQTYVGEQVQLRSDALGNGNGGRIVAWGDNATRVYGSLSARGGANGGDGGFIETSGHYLDMRGSADTRAPLGKTGQLLLDPTNITIISGSPSNSSNVQVTSNVFQETNSSTDSELDTGRLVAALGSNNITVSTANSGASAAGNLTVSGSISWSSSNSLTLRADNNIAIDNYITNSNAALVLNAVGGSISQTYPITAASLTATAPAGNIALTQTSNAISGAVTASASGNIQLVAQTLTTGAVTSSGSGVIQATSTSGALTIGGNVSTNGGAITLQSAYGSGIVTGSSTAISSGGGLIILQGDNMDLQGTISAGSGGISATARSTSQALHLGGTEADSANTLALSEAELQRLSTTGAITVTHNGDTGSPDVVVNALNVASSHPTGAFNIVAQGDADVDVQGNVSASGNLVLTGGSATTSRITVGGTLTSASGVVLSAGKLTVSQNITAPVIGVVSENSIDLGAASESSGILNVPTTTLSRFSTSNLSFTVEDTVSTGNITISQPLSWTGHLFLSAMNQYVTGSNSVTVSGQLALENGQWIQNSATLPTLSLGRLALTSAGFRRVTGGDGTSASPYQITDVYGLQGVTSFDNTSNFILANNIDASATSVWNNGSGFAPLGTSSSAYAGTFDGNNKTISGLTISRSGTNGVGLFGYLGAGTVKNLTLSGGSITGAQMTGAVAGQVTSSAGVISGVASSVPVSGVFAVGGVAGMNYGTVTGSSATGTVAASGTSSIAKVGGLVGYNSGTITKSFATGAVSTTVEVAGGLAGYNSGAITKSYATGSVTGGRSVGGLVGYNPGTVSDTYATGSVTGTTSDSGVTHANVGGLVGYSTNSVSTSYSTGAISASGFSAVQGAVGLNGSGTVTNVYWNSDNAGSGITDSAATSRTTAQLKQQSNLSGFNFSTTWQLYDGSTSAMLRDFLVPLTITLTGGTTSKTYDANAQAFDAAAAYSGFTGGDTSASLSGTLGWGTSGALHAGSYTPGGLSSTKYDISYTGASSSLTIAQRPVTATFSGSKVYDGTTSLSSPTFTIDNVMTVDASNLSLSGSASFANKNVGTSKPLTASVTLTGSAAPDYTLTGTSGTGTITAAPLTISGLSGVSRTYDATTAATLNTSTATLCCKATGDSVTVSYTPGLATFADKNVGTGKAITIGSGAFTLGGTDAGNYTMTPPTGLTADITPAALTVSGLSGVSRVYDATTTATVTGTPVLSGKIGSDVVSIASVGSGTFATKNVGTGKAITLPGSAFTLTGTDAGNYSVTAPSGLTANVTAATLTASGITATSRTYDTTTTAALSGTPVLSGVITVGSTTDDVSASPTLGSGSFVDKNVGTGKAVTAPGSVITLLGADAGNYTVSALTGLTADITAAPLTVSGLTASDRVYNTLTTVSTSGGSLVGILGSDVVAMGAVTAAFADKHAGTNKAVTVSNVAISGADAANYSVTMPTGVTATITPATLTVSGMTANSRVYDATTAATATGGTLSGILGSDDVALVLGTAAFADKNVGTGKAVTVSSVSLSGADAGNYSVTPPTGLTASITAASLTVTGITGVSRVYNGGTQVTLGGTPVLSGVLGSDTVSLSASLGTGAFADKNVGTAKAITIPGGALSVSGTDAANYTLVIPTGVTADITPAPLTLSGLSATSRVYNGLTSVATSGGSLSGVIEGETVALGAVTAAFADKNVGTGKAVTVSNVALSGADAGNYMVTPPTGLTANVTAAPLTVSGIAGLTRVYDGTAIANTSGGTLAGAVSGDSVAIGSVSATFADKNVGTGKSVTVSAVNLTGTDAGNYTVAVPTGLTAAITPATLTMSGITGVSKVYDNTTAATTTGGTLTGVFSGDSVTAGSFTATYADKNVGTAKPLTLTAITLSGTDAGNYTITQPTGITADITQRALATWTGGTDTLWTNASNWASGIVPDGVNVAGVVLPLSTGDVVLTSGSVTLDNLSVTGGQKVVVDGGTLNLGTSASHASTIAAMTMNSGAVNVTGALTGTNYVQTGGALGGAGNVTFSGFAQGGGSVGGLNAVSVTNNWSQTGGTFSIPGTLSIQHNSGNLVMKATTAQAGITLNVTEGGGISQNGPLVTNALTTSSQNGVTLNNAGNQILAYSGTDTGSGGITLVNTTGTSTLVLGAISSTNGGISIDNTGAGGIHASGALNAPTGAVHLTAHSPINVTSSITADSIALDASTNITLASGSSLSAVHNITIDAGTGIGIDGAVSSTSGSVSMTADTGNIVASGSASINSPGGVTLTTGTGSVTAPASIYASGTTPTVNDGAANAAANAAAEAAAKAAAEAAAQKAAEEAAAKAAAEAAAKKAAEEAAAKAAAEAAAKKAAEEAAAKAAAEAAAKKAAEEAAAKAAAEAAAKKAAEEAAAKAAAEAAANKAAEEAAAKAAAEAAAKKAAEEAAAKAAAEAAAKAAEEAAAKAAAEAAAKAAAEEAAAKAAAEAAAEAAAKAAAEAAAKKAAEEAAAKAAAEAAAKAAAEAAAKKAAEEAAAKAAAEAAAKAQQTKEAEPVRAAVNTTVNLINATTANVVDTAPATAGTGGASSSGTASNTSASSPASSGAASDGKSDGEAKKEEKKDGVAPQDNAPKKEEPVKKMYCN